MNPGVIVGAAFVVTLVVLGVLWLRRYRSRKAKVAYVTALGVTVLKSQSGKFLPKEDVERIHGEVIRFWSPTEKARAIILAAFNGARLGFVDTQKVYYKGVEQNARGQTLGKAMEVSIYDPALAPSLTGHEAQHLAMEAVGIEPGHEGAHHHLVARAAGSPY